MFKMISSILMSIVNFLKYPVIFSFIIFVLFFLLVFINIIIEYNKGNKKKSSKGYYKYIKKSSFIKKLIYDAPHQVALDIINKEPGFFPYQGLIIYEGRQGSGKSSTMIHDSIEILKKYPKAKSISNMGFTLQNDSLNHWKQLINYKNGIYGVVVLIDELQNWFGSNQSKNFPPEMLSVITQNRKNRRVIFGTTQSFHLLAKSIRSQTVEVRSCTTILGCITFVKKKIPILNSDGDVKEWKSRGFYWYVHNTELRNAYDTWAVIKSLSESGFKENSLSDNITKNQIIISKKDIKKLK